MGKQSKRAGRTARNTHERIKAEAEAARAAPLPGMRDADESPELAALMASARRRVESAMPSTFEHEGRTYYLRTRLVMQLNIFDTAGAAAPLMRGAVFSLEAFGHAPGH